MKYTDQVSRLAELCLVQGISNELLYGRVGYLYSANFVNKYFKREIVSIEVLKSIVELIVKVYFR